MKRYILPFVAAASLLFSVSWTLAERPVRKPTEPPSPPPEAASTQTVAAVGLVEPGTELGQDNGLFSICQRFFLS